MSNPAKISLVAGSVDEATLNTATLDNVAPNLTPGDAWRQQYFGSPYNSGNAAATDLSLQAQWISNLINWSSSDVINSLFLFHCS